MYSLQIDPRENNVTKVLEMVKKQTGYEVTEAQINQPKVKEALESDEENAARMMVTGTPTVYIDGEWDKTRDGYKKFIK